MEKTGILLAAPALILSFLLYGYPIFFNFYYSFFKLNLMQGPEATYVGLRNYTNVLADPLFYASLANTSLFAVASVIIEFVAGLVLALLLSKLKGLWMGLLTAVCMIPLFLSEVIEGIIGKFLFSPRIGVVTQIGESLFGVYVPWLTDKTLAMWTVIFVDAWKCLPFFVIIFLAAIISIPKEMEEAMNLDGASQIQQIRYLVIPYMLPVFAVSTVMRIIDAFTKVFGVVYVMTSGGPGLSTDVIPLRIFTYALRAFQWGNAATWGVFAFLISILMVVVYVYVTRRWKR